MIDVSGVVVVVFQTHIPMTHTPPRIIMDAAALQGETPGQEERELRAIEATDDSEIQVSVDAHEPLGDVVDIPAAAGARRSRSRSEEAGRGRVVAAGAGNPFGDVDDVCGVCLENPGDDSMVSLWCCKNILCIFDARKIGSCPFCREEPLVWNLRIPAQ